MTFGVHYYSNTAVDPIDLEPIHVIYTNDREGFQAWLNANTPSHRWSNSGRRVPELYPYYGKKAWCFGVKLSSDDAAKLAETWPLRNRDDVSQVFEGIDQ